jgi:hypothetical protein
MTAAAAFLFLTLVSPFGSRWHSALIWGARWAADRRQYSLVTGPATG